MSETVQQALAWAVSELCQIDTLAADTPKLDAEILLAHSLGQSRTWLKTWPDKQLTTLELCDFQQLIERRKAKEPVAYIVGHQDFWTFRLKVSPATLIPRPETEHLVEFALSKIPQEAAVSVADLGTGTGAIALAIASERPQATIYAVDSSSDALQIAESNRQQLSINNVQFKQGHWLRDWQGGQLDLIVSNPPYVATDDEHLADLAFEPLSALVAENQGLADIEAISQQARVHLKAGGWLIFEHGYQQAEAVQQILQLNGFVNVATVNDYAGLARVTYGQFDGVLGSEL